MSIYNSQLINVELCFDKFEQKIKVRLVALHGEKDRTVQNNVISFEKNWMVTVCTWSWRQAYRATA